MSVAIYQQTYYLAHVLQSPIKRLKVWRSMLTIYIHMLQHLKITYITHLLTYSMVQSPSWEANWFAASQEIPRISRNPKVHYRPHKRPPPVSTWASPMQSMYPHPTSWRSILMLSTHLRLGLTSGLLPSGSPPRPYTIPSPHPYVPQDLYISLSLILRGSSNFLPPQPNDIYWLHRFL